MTHPLSATLPIVRDIQSERYELKFPLQSPNVQKARTWLGHVGFMVSHPQRTVCSTYYDTQSHLLARLHVSGALYRGKLRRRWYNQDPDNFKWEWKYRTGGHGGKYSVSDRTELPTFCEQFLCEVSTIRYTRQYFHIPATPIRLTLDTKIRVGVASPATLPVCVMELKFPLGLKALPFSIPFIPSRFSKYLLSTQLHSCAL
jgi:hypothetical protein